MTKPKTYWLDPDRNLVIEDSVLQTLSSDYKRVYSARLHTAPPKREWVGLTTEQIEDAGFNLLPAVAQKDFVEFAMALEARLKEKNHD